MPDFIEGETVQADPSHLHPYHREKVAEFLDQITEGIDRRPERYNLTPQERAEWAAFPAQARAHPFETIMLDPHWPVAAYMRSGRIGPSYNPKKDY